MKKVLKNLFAFAFVIVSMMIMGIRTEASEAVVTIQKGVYVEDIDISGMTVQQATTRVKDYVTSLGNEKMTMNTADGNQVVITAGELGLTWSNKDVIEEACDYGKTGNIIQRYKAMKDLEHEDKVFQIEFSIDKQNISQIIMEKCSQFNVEAVDATLKKENGVFVVEKGQTGYKVDAVATADAIYNHLTSEWDHKAYTVDLVTAVEEPRGTEEELNKVKDVLGTFTTSFSSSGKARTANVTNGCSLVNGTTLYPGDTFSTYEAVSPFTEDNGYYMAGSYLNGMVIDSLGGGICQVSTTLYNAVLLSELTVTERYNHSMIVSYVKPSSDAAISGTSKDFKFTNSTEAPIYIEGITDSDKKITFTIYGAETRPASRKITYESEVISRTDPAGEKIIEDGSQPVGFIDVQSAHIGYVAKLWKIIEEDGVEVSRTEVNKSTYQLSPRTATVGVASPDPAVTAAMQAAIATGSIDHVKNIIGSYKASQAAVPPAAPPTPADADTAAEMAPIP